MATPPPPDRPKPVLGLLGGPGSGKSTVARAFAELGCAVIDADRLSHEALTSGAVAGQLREWWGERVFGADGVVDRKAVGRIVFEDADELARLEALIHPVVHEGRARERASAMADPRVRAVIEDCPLLLETGLEKQCDALVFVDCPFQTRLKRLSASRGWDERELRKREDRQIPLDTKRRSADYVVSNGEADAPLREQAEHVLQQIKRDDPLPGPR